MEGQGVTNYSVDRPSFGFTTSTTEFDDALIRRNVISKEDAILAKGASREHARTLLELERKRDGSVPVACDTKASSNERSDPSPGCAAYPQACTAIPPAGPRAAADGDDSEGGSEDDDDELLDDDVLRRYRERRLDELQTKRAGMGLDDSPTFGEAVFISRPDWTRHVNDASEHGWVVVCLTSSDTERTGAVETACQRLATKHLRTKFVLIPSHSAIPNWPEANLPSLFLYRQGKMQHQLVQLPADLSVQNLERMLQDFSVL